MADPLRELRWEMYGLDAQMPQDRAGQDEVRYSMSGGSDLRKCALCIRFCSAGPLGVCKKVSGVIAAKGICNLFQRGGEGAAEARKFAEQQRTARQTALET